MSNPINFNELWTAQEAVRPKTEELFVQIDKFRKKNRRSIVVFNVILILTCLFILWVWYYYQPAFITTKAGVVLAVLAMLILVIANHQYRRLFKSLDALNDNRNYLKNLEKIKAKQHFIQTKIMTLYFVLLSLGIGLYMYEYALRMKVLTAVFVYGITGLWILFNLIYVRPKKIKKQREKLNDLLEKLKSIQSQFDQ